MERLKLIMICFFSVVAIGGLILVILQKKGIVKPMFTCTANGARFVSGGTITFFATLAGMYMICEFSEIWAIVYAVLILVFYLVIQYAFRNKGE